MKKLLGICICLLLICAAIVPTVAFAADNGSTAEDVTYFLNPTAITAVGNKLVVADRIEADRSVIQCYDASGDEPILLDTIEVDGYVSNLSNKENTGLYAILEDKILEFTLSDGLKIARTINVTGAVDVAYGTDGSSKNEYILTQKNIVRNGVAGFYINELTNAKGCIFIGDVIYYLHEDSESGYPLCRSRDVALNSTPDDSLNKDNPNASGYYLANFKVKGLFVWNSNKVALFDDSTIATLDIGSSSQSTRLENVLTYDAINGTIKDVASGNDKIFILNSQNKIEVYAKNEVGNFVPKATLGSDVLNQAEPAVGTYTSFTLVKSKGYPTNIVFKTTGEKNSITTIKTDATEYIVLGYDGDETSKFYYVLLGDKFGWVKKSENANSVEEDEKLEVINTKVRNDNLTSKAKFVSLNAVFVSPLPRQFYYGEEYRTVYQQSATKRIEVTLHQKFIEGDTTWYLVTFEYNGAIHSGFVPQNAIGQFSITGNLENTGHIEQRKINSALFSTVKVYDETMTNYAYDADDNQIKLSSGDRVLLIWEKDGVAFIQIQNTNAFGYVYANNLIGVDQITTNAAVGLSLIAIAVALGVTLTVVFLKRRKRNKPAVEPITEEN